MKKSLTVFFVLISCFFPDCKKADPVDAVLGSFDDAIDKIENQSIAWQQTLKDLESQIKSDVSETIRKDLTFLVQTSIATFGTELRCNAEFFRDALKREIIRLKNKYLSLADSVTYLPNVCQTVESYITPETERVTVYGYDLLKEHLHFYLVRQDSSRQLIDKYVTFQSHFQLTIDIQGQNGLPFYPDSWKIVIECPTCDTDHRLLSEIGFDIPAPQAVKLDIVGGQGGNVFLEEPNLSSVKRISTIRLRYFNRVDAIAVEYQKYTDSIGVYKWDWGVWHGGTGGIDTIIPLNYDEEWIGIAGRKGAYIDQLLIQTTKRTYGPFGGIGGTPFDLLDQGPVIGIYGRSDQYLDALGLIIKK